MKQLGLCMTVKNEADQLTDCLDEIIDLFSQVQVIDTGARDDTVELLAQRHGAQITVGGFSNDCCYSLSNLRNKAFSVLQTPWILCLDANERIARNELQTFLNFDGNAEGYFTPRHTYLDGNVIEHYKLSLFKKGYQSLGLVHDNLQVSFRQRSASADWYPELTIKHYPPKNRDKCKQQYYEQRLHSAIGQQKYWVRYHWFLGYHQFRQNDHSFAEQNLQYCLQSQSPFFPVEVLNNAMVLLEIYSLIRDFNACQLILSKAMTF